MPNYCENTIKIKGKKEDIFDFFKKVGFNGETKESLLEFIENNKDTITMRSWLPMPQTFVDYDTTNRKLGKNYFNSDEEYEKYSKGYDTAVEHQKETYGAVGWYAYNLKTLGVKWDAKVFDYCVTMDEDDDVLCVKGVFDTAWCAPLMWVTTIAKENPKLSFDLDGYEYGCGFHQGISCENGEVIYEIDEDIECEEDEWEEDEDEFEEDE